jgi:hypothetical protein
MLKHWTLAAGLCAAFVAVAAASDNSEGRMLPDPNTARLEEAPGLPSVRGKYRVLLRKIHVPQDEQGYGKFTDFGKYPACSWAGYNDLPEGYWVYVYPHWYIWRDCVNPNAKLPGAQPGPGPGQIQPEPDVIPFQRPLTK